jgi:cobalt-zinc-cadmium efflux system membrane fusion protein
VLFFTACGDKQESEQKSGYRIQGDTVYIADPLLLEKIKVSVSELKPYSKKVITSGVVRPIPPRYAYVAPPFAGRVTKSYVRIGQSVRQGTPLFEISSPDFTSAQKEYFQALSSRELAKKDLKRKEDLIRNGVSSQRELEEAQNALLIADKEFENASAALRVYQVDNLAEMILGQPMIVRSPIPGEVIKDNIVTGQYLKDDTEPIAIVADLSKVWIAAQVKEKDIRFINEGSSLDIEISALPGTVIKGNVYHVEEEVDEETRSIQVLSVCDNLNGHLKLGMYTTVHFLSVPVGQIQIPEKTLLQGEKDSYVFVQIAPLVFVRTSVTVETTENGIAVISEGLRPGDKIISEGGYYLK